MKEYIDDWMLEYNKRNGSDVDHTAETERLITSLLNDEQDLHPDLQALYHLFHPNDPVAYRLEPLVAKALAAQKPYPIPVSFSKA
jgi:hypothetical protein